jgi:hypothetical protein
MSVRAGGVTEGKIQQFDNIKKAKE